MHNDVYDEEIFLTKEEQELRARREAKREKNIRIAIYISAFAIILLAALTFFS